MIPFLLNVAMTAKMRIITQKIYTLRNLSFIIDWINQYKEEITESTNDRANELLGDVYDEIFGDERGQVFKVEDMNFKFGGIRVVKVGDYYETNDHFPLYNEY